MKGQENLIPVTERSKEEARAMSRKGGINSGKARRRKKTFKESLEVILDLTLKRGEKMDVDDIQSLADIKGKNISVQDAINIAMVQRAIKGDKAAAEWVRDTSGQKQAEKVEMTGEINNPLSGLTTEELRKLVDND